MLSIKPLTSDGDILTYYAHLGEAESHDYYSEDGARPGVWRGEGAGSLGLAGDVTPEAFRNLLEGKSPDGARSLVQNQRGARGRRAGFDLTFSLPKSFSVLWSQASEADRFRLDTVAERALLRTLRVVEELCGKTRRGKGSHAIEDARLVFAVFQHDTARGVPGEAPDANRHYHCVTPNVAVREDGTSGAIDARHLFSRRMKNALGGLFRAEVSMLLQDQLGVATHRPNREGRDEPVSWWEVTGVPEGLVRAMSKRRAEVETWLRRHGLSGAKAAEKAALVTRADKKRFTRQELDTAWAEQGRAWGFGRQQAANLFGNNRSLTPEEKLSKASEVSDRALTGLLDHAARFTRNELLEQAAIESQGAGVGIDDVTRAVEAQLTGNREIVRLQDKERVPSYTTREMLRLERQALDAAARLSRRHGHAISSALVHQVTAGFPTLKHEQQRAVERIATGGDAICVTGFAGTGKTFMLGVAKRVLEASGYRLLGTSLAAKSAKVLEANSGIESTHLDRLFVELDRGLRQLDYKTVVIVDEAGTVGTRHMASLLSRVEAAGAKVVLVGDERQTQAVAAGAPFRKITETLGTTEMTQVVRQQDAWARQVVLDLRAGDAAAALTALDRRGRLFLALEREDAIERLCERWERLALRAPGGVSDVLVMSSTVLDTRELNRRVQDVMRRRGQLGDYAIEVDGLRLHLGDRVMLTRNNRLLGVENGTLGEVTGVHAKRIWVRLDSGFEVEIDTEIFSHVTLAYAQTVHKAQGTTCEHAFYFVGAAATDRELSYVAGSRARQSTSLFTYEAAALGLDELAAMMSRSRQNEMAIEHTLEAV
ncbi:MobF family relaxase [Botrimarina mediterranea]|uniref:MobF family relaxase n=1 Tax=Botrimarina mediterranea TaxID=2528022 RepID=UPI0018D4D8BD|nr:MobF family relaxase [Botrimarina mediterranea]